MDGLFDVSLNFFLSWSICSFNELVGASKHHNEITKIITTIIINDELNEIKVHLSMDVDCRMERTANQVLFGFEQISISNFSLCFVVYVCICRMFEAKKCALISAGRGQNVQKSRIIRKHFQIVISKLSLMFVYTENTPSNDWMPRFLCSAYKEYNESIPENKQNTLKAARHCLEQIE